MGVGVRNVLARHIENLTTIHTYFFALNVCGQGIISNLRIQWPMVIYVVQSAVQVLFVWKMVCPGRTLRVGSKAGRRVYHSTLEV